MTPREFFDLTSEMRFYQLLYRHFGSVRARAKARKLEQQIDREVTRVTHILRSRQSGG